MTWLKSAVSGGWLAIGLTALTVTALLAPTVASAAPRSGLSYLNEFETFKERDLWKTYKGDAAGVIGASADNPRSGRVHGRMVAMAGYQQYSLRYGLAVPQYARCAAQIWGTLTGDGHTAFIVRDTAGTFLSGATFRRTVQPTYQRYVVDGFYLPADRVLNFTVTLKGSGPTYSTTDIDDFALQCTW